MTLDQLKAATVAAEALLDKANAAVKQARADFGRSRSVKRAVALSDANDLQDYAARAFRRAEDSYIAALNAAEASARLAARPENTQMEMFA